MWISFEVMDQEVGPSLLKVEDHVFGCRSHIWGHGIAAAELNVTVMLKLALKC